MDTLHLLASLQWSTDLSVGCEALDKRNRSMLDVLSAREKIIATVTGQDLSGWLANTLDQFDDLLSAEETELAAVDYPELDFHRKLHDQGRTIAGNMRAQLRTCDSDTALILLTCAGCASIALWFVRHVQDADPFFYPYVDVRYRTS